MINITFLLPTYSPISPIVISATTCLLVNFLNEKRLVMVEMRILRWSMVKTRRYWIYFIRGMTTVIEVSRKAQERRLEWFGYVVRRVERHVSKKVWQVQVDGRRIGKPWRRWKDVLYIGYEGKGIWGKRDMSEDVVGQADEEEDLCLYIFFMLIFSKLTKYFVQPFWKLIRQYLNNFFWVDL